MTAAGVTPGAQARIVPPFYPIVYVRGYAMTSGERDETFQDAYYGFSANSVERRNAAPGAGYVAVDIFEGQLIRFMKAHGYVDACHGGLALACERGTADPSRSIWISRFYDRDVLTGTLRSIVEHAEDLRALVCEAIPSQLREAGVIPAENDAGYKVILVAHSMGGLVCRTLIQNVLPARRIDPTTVVHRLVTLGTPHGGITLDAVPHLVQSVATGTLNMFDAGMFLPERMVEYLKLPPDAKPTSLGDSFPPTRCLCVIGSDHASYGAVRFATGGYSDGLVKQNNAYVDGAYYANVHRAHSGQRGIVNSYESFENIRRFLFGNIKVAIALDDVRVGTQVEPGYDCFYDVEFVLSVRGTGVYLHRREEDPCENAIRRSRKELDGQSVLLHVGFMNSNLKRDVSDDFSHFLMKLRVVERRVKHGLLWDHEYPDRVIFNEMLEVGVGDHDRDQPGDSLKYRWLSDSTDGDFQPAAAANGSFRIPLRPAAAFAGRLRITPAAWDGD